MGRKLTDEEKEKFSVWARDREAAKHPGAVVSVTIDEELDDDGVGHYRTEIITEEFGWKP